MKAVTSPVIITGVATRSDGSLSLRLSTPELTPDEKLVFLQLQNIQLKALLQPMEGEPELMKEVKGELDEKTPSQRLRSVLYVAWKSNDEVMDFEVFYKQKMNGIIDKIKATLPQHEFQRA